MNRRLFFKNMSLLLLAMLARKNAYAQQVKVSQPWIPKGRRVSAMQGYTDNTSTQIILLLPTLETFTYLITDSQGAELAVDSSTRSTHPDSRFCTEQLIIKGLSGGQSYRLTISNSKNEIVDSRIFKTLNSAQGSAKIGLMSCMDDRSPIHSSMWKAVSTTPADMLFFLGDNVYVDDEEVEISADSIWERHVETRLNLDIFQAETLTPIIAIWDDHDYAQDDGDRRFSLRDESLKIFKSFFGSSDGTFYKNGPGVSSYMTLFKQRFLFLDSRYFRDKSSRRDATVWGSEQMNWIRSQIDQQCQEPIWLINGSQFFGGYHTYESVERESMSELDEIISIARSANAPTVFASGDVHFSEISKVEESRLGYSTFELTSSAIHSTKADDIRNNPRRVALARENNFMIVDASASSATLDLTVNIYGSRQVYNTSSYKIEKR